MAWHLHFVYQGNVDTTFGCAIGAEIEMKRREFLTRMGTAATLSAFAAGFLVGKAFVEHQGQQARLTQGLPQSVLQALRFERNRLRPSG